MKTKKYSRLLAIVMLMMIVKPAYFAAVDIDLPKEGEFSQAQKYYEQIPVEKRNSFIKHNLAEGMRKEGKAVNLSSRSASESFDEFGTPPPNFTTNLLKWAMDEFELEDQHVEAIVTSVKKVCIPSKGCYPDDIGGHCCPF